jgi:hypothetical protein
LDEKQQCRFAWEAKAVIISAEVLSQGEIAVVERIFRSHGCDAPVRIAQPVGNDERIFVLPAATFVALSERAVTQELQDALGRKVWLVPESPEWPATVPLR